MEQIHFESQVAIEEPGFDEDHFVILLLRADRGLQSEFLAAAGEVGWVEQVEVSLVHPDVTDELVNGTEAGAKIKIARGAFLDAHDQVLVVRDEGRLHLRLHAGKVLQTFQALFAQLDANHVEHVAG